MSTDSGNDWSIGPVRPQECQAAFELALKHLPDKERRAAVLNAMTLLAAGELHREGVLVARAPAGLVGVQVCVPLKGASGLCWLPQVGAPHDALAVALAEAGLAWLRTQGARFAQALVAPSLRSAAGPLLAEHRADKSRAAPDRGHEQGQLSSRS